MFVNFKRLRFKNILSYGNAWTEIDFSNGLNLIKAPNGSGKSTILDALCFGLYGKPFRNIKLGKLVNRINDKNLEVEIEFDIGYDRYKIYRSLKPSKFEIYKNGDDVDMLSSKKLNQNEIEKLIGINQKLFKNIVCIAVTNNKPFLSMPIWEKRELIENIFNIDVLAEMNKEVKRRKGVNQTEEKIKVNESGSVEKLILDNKSYIQKMTSYIHDFNDIRQKDIDAVDSRIKEIESKIEQHTEHIRIANEHLKKMMDKKIDVPDTEKYKETIKEMAVAEAEKKRIQKTLKEMSGNSVCPICGTSLSEGHAKEHRMRLETEFDELDSKTIPKLKDAEKTYLEMKKAYDDNQGFIKLVESKKLQEENSIERLKVDIESSFQKKKEIENRNCPVSLIEYEDKLVKLNEQLNSLRESIELLNHSIQLDSALIDVLGDDGMKVYFFRKLIPIMNQNVNEYLKKFGMPITLEFDEQMQETIMNGMTQMDYDQFSSGEKTRIDMSVLLSFFNISRIISNWSSSLLVIDEVLDSNVDKDGIEQFMATLYNIVSENEKRLGIYIISHKLSDMKFPVQSTVNISKKGLFSSLEVVK